MKSFGETSGCIEWATIRAKNSSNIHFMDLADRSITNSNTEQQRITTGPFDLILSYLNLNSLQSLSRTNRKCSQLLDDYVGQHSQKAGTFTISNEFYTEENYYEFKQLTKFAEHVTDLRVNIFHSNSITFRHAIKQFHNLRKKLYVHTDGFHKPHDFIVPQVRHYIFQANPYRIFLFNYSNLYELSCICPNLQIFELKQTIVGSLKITDARWKFRKLKTFVFAYDGRFASLEEFQSTGRRIVGKKK